MTYCEISLGSVFVLVTENGATSPIFKKGPKGKVLFLARGSSWQEYVNLPAPPWFQIDKENPKGRIYLKPRLVVKGTSRIQLIEEPSR